jgi:hypothetical protein
MAPSLGICTADPARRNEHVIIEITSEIMPAARPLESKIMPGTVG